MSREPDYYAILQIDPRAESEVIQAAYRRLAAKYHPDVAPSPSAEERMKQLNAAYEVLSDPEKRRAYDLSRAGHRPEAPAPLVRLRWQRGWWLLPVALMVLASALRFNPRLALLILLFLALWLIWNSRR